MLAQTKARQSALTNSIPKVNWIFQDDSYGEFAETANVRM